jgi:tetratricopeptide (TPR) repeat protein
MKSFFYKSLISLWGMSLVLVFLAPLTWAANGLEEMDLKTLSGEAAPLQKHLDQNPADYEALQGLGIVYHYMAIKDSKAYAKKAVQVLEQATKSKPEDYMVVCCLGSAYTLMAKDDGNPMNALNLVNKGIEYLDKAVRKDPENVVIRMIRANNSKGLPKFLNRRSIAYEDFEYLAGLFEKGQTFPSPLKASVYRQLAALNQEDGQTAKAKKFQAMAQNLDKEK